MRSASAPTRPARIVVVDDNPADVFLIQEALRTHQIEFELTRFEDGEKALAALCSDDGRDRGPVPDLILLDLNMPRANGIEVLKRIRQKESLAAVPIAILTSSLSPRDKEDATAIGAVRFVTKPTELTEFLDLVGGAAKELLLNKRS